MSLRSPSGSYSNAATIPIAGEVEEMTSINPSDSSDACLAAAIIFLLFVRIIQDSFAIFLDSDNMSPAAGFAPCPPSIKCVIQS